MTTIVYKDGVLAFDSLITAGNTRVGYITKGKRIGDYLVAGAGDPHFVAEFMDWVRHGFDAQHKPEVTEIDSEIFCVHKDNLTQVIRYDEDIFPIVYAEIVENGGYATGSGAQYALGAMAIGASARVGLWVAKAYDCYTGGELQSISFDDEE